MSWLRLTQLQASEPVTDCIITQIAVLSMLLMIVLIDAWIISDNLSKTLQRMDISAPEAQKEIKIAEMTHHHEKC